MVYLEPWTNPALNRILLYPISLNMILSQLRAWPVGIDQKSAYLCMDLLMWTWHIRRFTLPLRVDSYEVSPQDERTVGEFDTSADWGRVSDIQPLWMLVLSKNMLCMSAGLTSLFSVHIGSSLGCAMYASWKWEWNPVVTSSWACAPCWPLDSSITLQGGSAYRAGATNHVSPPLITGHNLHYSMTFDNLFH